MVNLFGIGQAVKELQHGNRVARQGWNGKGMFLVYVQTRDFRESDSMVDFIHQPFVAMKTADDKVVPWLCSQSDLLARDWTLANG